MYDTTYGTIVEGVDNIVVIDDSIVRNDVEAKYYQDFVPLEPQKDRDRFFFSPDSLPGLLWNRYVSYG